MLLEKNLAIASYTKALEFRNGKCFRKVTEEGYRVGPGDWGLGQESEVEGLEAGQRKRPRPVRMAVEPR